MKLSERVKTAVFAAGLALAGVGGVLVPSAVYADGDGDGDDTGTAASTYVQQGMKKTGLKSGDNDSFEDKIKDIIKVILWVVGILSVVVIIYGGIQYTISTGDQSKVTAAKNTIIYGLVGLAISIMAYAIVSFVVDKISSNSSDDEGDDTSMVQVIQYEPVEKIEF